MRLAFVLVLAACGRLGFDARTTDGAGSAQGTPVTLTLPDGGEIDFINVSATHAWYAVTHAGAAYRSDDHATWIACGRRFTTQIASLDNGHVYAGGADTAVSTDSCATWTELGAGRFTGGIGNYNNVIYALLDNGLRTWNGTTWTTVTTPLDGARFKSFAAFGTGQFLIGTGNGLLHSPDGTTWTAVATFPSNNIVDVATSMTHTYAISAASGSSSGAVSCSDGTAQTWTTCFAEGGTAVAVDPTNDQHAFAAIYDNLVETQDAFANEKFDQRGGAMGYAAVHDVRIMPNGTVVAATDRGVYTAAPGTINWQPALAGLGAWTIEDIALAGDEVYIATTGGVLHGTRGQPYTHSFSGMSPNTINNAIVVAPDGTVISAGRMIWTSTDHGATWAATDIGSADGYRAFAAYLDGTRVWIGTGSTIYIGDPPYTTWMPLALGKKVNALLRTDTRMWAASDSGLLYTDDNGATWQSALTSYCESLALLPDGSLAVGTVAGTQISDATRTTWTARGPTAEIRHLAVAGGALVAATDGGLFASHDGGATWTRGPTGAMNTVVVDPADGQLVVGTDGAGLAKAAIP